MYLAATGQQSVYVPNIVTSNLTYEMEGLAVKVRAGLDVNRIELGNEIYDHTVPEILFVSHAPVYQPTCASPCLMISSPTFPRARFPNASVYAEAMGAWVQGVRSLLPQATIALCGGLDMEWNQALFSSPVRWCLCAATGHWDCGH